MGQVKVTDSNRNIVSTGSDLKKEPRNVFFRNNYYYIKSGDFDIVWPNVAIFTAGHILFFYALIKSFSVLLTSPTIGYTFIFSLAVIVTSGFGITAGAHRLWAHKSYEAALPLQIFLMICQCVAGENCIYIWARDHRVHHKFSETDGDPHNTKRGFFFAHVGWLMRKKHPEMKRKAASLTFTDLLEDPVVKFQMEFYYVLYFIFALALPTLIPVLCWGEHVVYSFLVAYVMRYVLLLHGTWFVNSTAHMFGHRPYNPKIQPRENLWVSLGALGEGFHNYHHTFPWDYSTSESGNTLNVTKMFIDLMAYMGLARNLKKPSNEMIEKRREKATVFVEENGHGNGQFHESEQDIPEDMGF